MRIINKDKTHFMQRLPNKSTLIKYDTIDNVNLVLNNILDKGNQQMCKMHAFIAFKKEAP